MAPTPPAPLVDHTLLVQPGSAAEAIPVGSPAWYAWLADASSFAFIGVHGTFTAHKERRSPAREYWKAYRRRAGRLHRAYLGKSSELTLDRLNAVAADLAGGGLGAAEDARPHPPARRPRPPDAPAPAQDDARPLHLLLTKLAIPAARPNPVPRPRLAEQLDAAISQGQKLILLSAPAGFGKTTLITEWLAARSSALRIAQAEAYQEPPRQHTKRSAQNVQAAWLALDDDDNHLGQFLAYLIATLETVRPGIGAEAWALLRTRAAQPPSQAILTLLVNALADSADRIVLVLDDYHTITLQAIHEAVAFVLDRMPAQMHILMTSRADPPLSLARLRVRGQLTEIRAADLRFTPEEATHFFARLRGLRMPADAVAVLEARTEGWVAGLQLAALSLEQQGLAQMPTFIADFAGSHHYVFDYLADEVFERQPDHVRTFLMQTAILARLCGPLCDAVTGQDDGQTLLEHLDETNLFLIRLDSSRHWYRYHHLFRDFLRERLERTLRPAHPALLHRRASAWFEQHDLIGEAIEHALSAREWGDAMRCIAPLMEHEQFYDYYLDWPRWLAALPDAVLQVAPDFCLRFAWVLVLTGQAEAAECPLDWAEAAWHAAGNQPKLGEVLSKRAVALSFIGDFPRAITLSHQALDMLPLDAVEQRAIPTYILGRSQIALGHVESATDLLIAVHAAIKDSNEPILSRAATLGMAWVYQLQGQLQRAAALYQDVIRRASSATQQQPAAYIYLGTLYYEWNDLAAAEQMLRMGIEAGQRTGRGRYWPRMYSALARVLWARGDAAQAGTMMEQALASARSLGPFDIIESEAQQVWLWLARGDMPTALRWLTARALNADDEVPYERQTEYLMLARIRIAKERQEPGSVDVHAVVRLLDRLRQAAEVDKRMSDRVAILGLTALAYAAQREPSQATASLGHALALAEPEGYIRTFVDEGAPMRAVLIEQRVRVSAGELGTRPAYIDRLLQTFPQAVPPASSESAIPELLSERERAVLQLLAAGRSIQEIATLLVISVHTARTHVKNIYAKLDAHNRVQSLERARALHLL
jgi:LuxR family maltose regulon positive regulatory protein